MHLRRGWRPMRPWLQALIGVATLAARGRLLVARVPPRLTSRTQLNHPRDTNVAGARVGAIESARFPGGMRQR